MFLADAGFIESASEVVDKFFQFFLQIGRHSRSIEELMQYLSISNLRKVEFTFDVTHFDPSIRLRIVIEQLHHIIPRVFQKQKFIFPLHLDKLAELFLGVHHYSCLLRVENLPLYHIILAHNSGLPMFQTTVKIQETDFVSGEFFQNRSVQVPALVDSLFMHIAVVRLVFSLGSKEHLFARIVHKHCLQLLPLCFDQEPVMLNAILRLICFWKVWLANVKGVNELWEADFESIVETFKPIKRLLNSRGQIFGIDVDQIPPVSVNIDRRFIENNLFRLTEGILKIFQVFNFVPITIPQ